MTENTSEQLAAQQAYINVNQISQDMPSPLPLNTDNGTAYIGSPSHVTPPGRNYQIQVGEHADQDTVVIPPRQRRRPREVASQEVEPRLSLETPPMTSHVIGATTASFATAADTIELPSPDSVKKAAIKTHKIDFSKVNTLDDIVAILISLDMYWQFDPATPPARLVELIDKGFITVVNK